MRIETGRLRLRVPREDDLDAYLAYRNEPAALGSQRMDRMGEAAARTLLREQADLPKEATGWRMLVLEEHAQPARPILGEVGVFLHPDRPEGNIGWWLHSRAHGRGLATEAARALIGWCFIERELHRVTAGCLADNVASFAVMRRLGMRLETHSRESRLVGEAWFDELGCALLRREWSPQK